MASSKQDSVKVLCVVCNKSKGIFKCEGCSKIFCLKHSTDHRNELSKQLEEIEASHNLVQQILCQQTEDPRQHPLLKKINQWEEESIVQIRQAAEEAREKLLRIMMEPTTKIKQELKSLSDQLRQSHEDNDFIESDLQQWTQKLDALKKELLNPTTFIVRENSATLVAKLHVDHNNASDVFERVCGKAEIKDDQRLIVKDSSTGHTELRGRKEYLSGEHILRFQIEHLSGNPWIFFGIISKSEPMRINSYSSQSTYGWGTTNQIYAAGRCQNNSSCDAVQNDIITLLINCDQRRIQLKNERTQRELQMPVDMNVCPFPWQFHLNVFAPFTSVRILSS